MHRETPPRPLPSMTAGDTGDIGDVGASGLHFLKGRALACPGPHG